MNAPCKGTLGVRSKGIPDVARLGETYSGTRHGDGLRDGFGDGLGVRLGGTRHGDGLRDGLGDGLGDALTVMRNFLRDVAGCTYKLGGITMPPNGVPV